jgi:hypothetical protein
MTQERFITVETEKGYIVHWMLEREVVGPSFAPALCGRRPPRGGWLEERQARGTCTRCIERLPYDERKRLYPLSTP